MADSTEVDSTTVSSTAGGGAPAADNPPPRRSRSPFARGRAAEGPRAKVSDLWPYLFEQRGIMAFIVVLSILGAAASLAQPLLVSGVITSVEAQEPLGVLIWALVGLVVVAGLLNGFQHYLLQRTGEGVVLSSRKRLVGRLLNLPISEFDTRRTGDLVSRVGSDTTLLRAVLTQGLVESVGGSLTFLGALIAMLIIDPVLLGLTVLVVVLAIGLVVGLSGRIRVATTKAQAKVGELTASVERAISSVRTIRAAGATKRELAKVEEDATGAYFMGLQVAKISAFVVPVASICMQVAFITVIGVGGYRVATGATTIAQLVMFILFLFMMIMPLGQALGAISAVSSALGALGRIQEVIDLPSEGENDRDLAPLSGTGPSADPRVPAIEFEDVRFAYATAGEKNADGTPGTKVETPVLHGVSFRVERGKRTALVGPSGAGKSTILALIERFYDVTGGRILMGGEDLRTLDRAEFRSLIGYVEQDAAVLAGTIRDNLLIAKPDASDDECVEVLRSVNLHGVLERNPAGLSAQVGEDGIMLSGGEKQRLAIARALLAACPILLLDESTSSLDGVNEQLMREAIDAVATDRTLLVIAHRLSTVVDSDTIIVLEQGRVAGIGTHSELVQSTPLYKELAKHQLLV